MKRLHLLLAAIGLTSSITAFAAYSTASDSASVNLPAPPADYPVGVSGAAYPAASDPTLINVPKLPVTYSIGVTGFFMQASPSNGDLNFASLNKPVGSNQFDSSLFAVDPSYDWTFGFNLGYTFDGTANDVQLIYFYDDTNDKNSVFTDRAADNITIPNFNFGSLSEVATLNVAAAEEHYRINQLDLFAGQFVNVGSQVHVHPKLGLRYVDIDRKLNSAFIAQGLGNTGTAAINMEEDTDFSGAGPIAGLDANYYVGGGFGFVGHLDSALLFGRIQANTQIQTAVNDSAGDSIASNNYAFVTSYTNRLVPVTDMKLGMNYSYLFDSMTHSDLTLELGYQLSHYYHAIDRLTESADITGTTPGSISATTTSDLSFGALYANLTFNV